MHANPRYDFLLSPEGTHEFHMAHRNDTPDQVAVIRAALREDARPRIRVNAIVALGASQQERAMPDFITALDDPDPSVLAEAAFATAVHGGDSMSHPEDPVATAALRAHASAIRAALTSDSVRVRFNAATALVDIADQDTDLKVLLHDGSSLVRSLGVDLAVARGSANNTLSSADVAVLDEFARTDTDADLRIRAVNVIVDFAPALAVPVVLSAFTRGDVDPGTARGVVDGKLSALAPAIVAYLEKHPKSFYWIDALVALKATCASNVLARLLDDVTAGERASEALKKLSGHGDWSRAQLVAWATKQPPCS